MTTVTAGAPRTKAERGAATRVRLLDATVDCLVELGWAGTSTTEVVRRAGVSRGAQVHHYPTKEDLVLAAIEHLLQRRLDEYHAAFDRLPAAKRTPTQAVELLWESCFGRTFEAWLELAVASRHDDVLRRRFREVEARFWTSNVERFAGMFPEVAADPQFAAVALRFAFSVLDGLAIGRLIGVSEDDLSQVRIAFTTVVQPFFPISQGGTG